MLKALLNGTKYYVSFFFFLMISLLLTLSKKRDVYFLFFQTTLPNLQRKFVTSSLYSTDCMKISSLLYYVPSRLCTWRAFAAHAYFRLRTFAPYLLSWRMFLTALRSFMPYVPWSLCVLTTRFAPHICGSYSSLFKCDNISY